MSPLNAYSIVVHATKKVRDLNLFYALIIMVPLLDYIMVLQLQQHISTTVLENANERERMIEREYWTILIFDAS